MQKQDKKISWFSTLPEGCISSIISFTSPKDASRFSILSHAFKSAAESDTVWERFLPSDCDDIIARSVSPLMNFTSKKQLYFHLCDHPILLDDGKLSFKLSKASGKKCYMLCARKLEIAHGGDPRYWKWISTPESRFSQVAELLAVCWLEIRGTIRAEILSSKTAYAAYLVFRLEERNVDLDGPSEALLRFAQDGEGWVHLCGAFVAQARNVYLKELESLPDGLRAQRRTDGWMEIRLGEFFNNQEDDVSVVKMMFWDTSRGWKRGLIVEGIELRPLEEA